MLGNWGISAAAGWAAGGVIKTVLGKTLQGMEVGVGVAKRHPGPWGWVDADRWRMEGNRVPFI